MPYFVLDTNLPVDKIPKTFLQDASKLVARELGKPESYVCVRVNPGQLMTYGGSDAPCGWVEIECIGVVGPEKNKQLTPVIGNFVEKSLGIPQDRFTIKFSDVSGTNFGWNGNTFA